MQLAMQMKRLEATNIESLEIRHQALLEIVKSGIREFQIVEQSTILEIKTINGPHLLRLLDLAAEADPESTGGNQ